MPPAWAPAPTSAADDNEEEDAEEEEEEERYVPRPSARPRGAAAALAAVTTPAPAREAAGDVDDDDDDSDSYPSRRNHAAAAASHSSPRRRRIVEDSDSGDADDHATGPAPNVIVHHGLDAAAPVRRAVAKRPNAEGSSGSVEPAQGHKRARTTEGDEADEFDGTDSAEDRVPSVVLDTVTSSRAPTTEVRRESDASGSSPIFFRGVPSGSATSASASTSSTAWVHTPSDVSTEPPPVGSASLGSGLHTIIDPTPPSSLADGLRSGDSSLGSRIEPRPPAPQMTSQDSLPQPEFGDHANAGSVRPRGRVATTFATARSMPSPQAPATDAHAASEAAASEQPSGVDAGGPQSPLLLSDASWVPGAHNAHDMTRVPPVLAASSAPAAEPAATDHRHDPLSPDLLPRVAADDSTQPLSNALAMALDALPLLLPQRLPLPLHPGAGPSAATHAEGGAGKALCGQVPPQVPPRFTPSPPQRFACPIPALQHPRPPPCRPSDLRHR